MAERTYLFSYGDGPFGASSTRRTRAYIEKHRLFVDVHPVLMDRLFDLADAVIDAGSDYGFGGGWRSSTDQMTVFTQRYTKVDKWTGLYWDGSPDWPEKAGYYVHTSGAPSAPPGRSYHESTTDGGKGFALAVDMVGDHRLGNPMAATFGLKHFANVNGEPWHYQPVEIPNARRSYGGEFENVTLPVEPPVVEEDEMDPDKMILWRPKGFQNIFIINPAGVFHASMPLLKAFGLPTDAAGITKRVIEDDHPQTRASMLAQAGLTYSDLVPVK